MGGDRRRAARGGWQEGVCHSGPRFPRRAGDPIVKVMFAVYAARIDRDQPLDGLESGERPAPETCPGWSTVTVKAASLNHHDLWSLRGVGLAEDKLPMILGCDAAGVDDDQLLSAAHEFARGAASAPRELAIVTKQTIADMAGIGTHPDAVQREFDPQLWTVGKPWFAERIAALQAKIKNKLK